MEVPPKGEQKLILIFGVERNSVFCLTPTIRISPVCFLGLAGVRDVDGSAVSTEPQTTRAARSCGVMENWKSKYNSHQDCYLGVLSVLSMLSENSDGN